MTAVSLPFLSSRWFGSNFVTIFEVYQKKFGINNTNTPIELLYCIYNKIPIHTHQARRTNDKKVTDKNVKNIYFCVIDLLIYCI